MKYEQKSLNCLKHIETISGKSLSDSVSILFLADVLHLRNYSRTVGTDTWILENNKLKLKNFDETYSTVDLDWFSITDLEKISIAIEKFSEELISEIVSKVFTNGEIDLTKAFYEDYKIDDLTSEQLDLLKCLYIEHKAVENWFKDL